MTTGNGCLGFETYSLGTDDSYDITFEETYGQVK